MSDKHDCTNDPTEHAAMIVVLAYKYLCSANQGEYSDIQLQKSLAHAVQTAFVEEHAQNVWASFQRQWENLVTVWEFDDIVEAEFPDAAE